MKNVSAKKNGDENQDNQQSKLMYSNTETPSYREYNNKNRGRGQGGRGYYRGRGRGRSYWDNRDASRVMCFRCDKIGHFAATCPDRLLKLSEAQESKEDDTQEADG